MQKKPSVNNFKSNAVWIFFGNIVFGFSQWLMISTMAKFGDVEMVGEYTLALGLTAPLFLLFNLNLRSMQATDQKNGLDFTYYFSFRFITSGLALLIVIILILIFEYTINTTLIILLVALIKAVESQSDVAFGYFQKIEHMKLISLSQILKGFLNIFCITIILWITDSLIMALFGLLLVNLLILVIFDIQNLYKNNVQRLNVKDVFFVIKDKKTALTILIMGIPLGIASFLDSLNINSQRFIIEANLSIEEVGFYSSITFIMMSGQTVIGALAHAALPSLTRQFIEDVKMFIKSVWLLIFIGILIGCSLILLAYFLGEFILSILYTNEFAQYSDIFFIIMIVASIWYLTGFLNVALMATRKFKFQLYVYLLSFIVTFVCSVVFTKNFGLTGAAFGLLAGMLTRLLIVSLILSRITIERKLTN
ncbi:lipopolysaccharide biosynthesis protein [Bacillus sp. FJAT-27986]|uniref:lipopolysaccharide biosynthesis protein n=1 Tax=Bacillus sp. FJAT-27986 TaxID=1743146 RepID=UPI00080AFC8E|nr:oligosaccharide flippase family protein [Bacillus sp. FJAT-27986]OCA84609.1 hypothetical protein A8L44_09410 [Bacillus sp. FJAT-27986]